MIARPDASAAPPLPERARASLAPAGCAGPLVLVLSAAVVSACGQAPAVAPAAGPGAAAKSAPAAAAPREPQRARDVTTPPEVAWTTRGSGPELKAGDAVFLHLVGRLPADGKVIVDTRTTDAPVPHRVGSGHLVHGLDLVIPRLRVGDRVTTTLRSDLAYGDDGVRSVVPPKSEVAFDVEVVSLVPDPTWEVVTKGAGREAARGTLVSVHYVGTLADGKQFDSSREREEPLRFRVGAGEVIEGLDHAVARMREGDRWKILVPWVWAYGTDGAAPDIPPKADLTFDLEVVRVED